MSFDSNLLTVNEDDLILSDSLQNQNWQKTISQDISGEVTVNLRGTALAEGATDLLSLNASVPENATYGQTNNLSLDSIELNNGDLEVIGDTATHLVAYLGDVDRDRAYTMEDAHAISRFVVGLESEFSAFPDTDPGLIADINGDGVISSLDAALVANVVNGIASEFIPPLT